MGQHLVVGMALVLHEEQPDGAHPDPATRKSRLRDQGEDVERVAVIGVGVGDEAVVGGIDHRGEEEAVRRALGEPPGLAGLGIRRIALQQLPGAFHYYHMVIG